MQNTITSLPQLAGLLALVLFALAVVVGLAVLAARHSNSKTCLTEVKTGIESLLEINTRMAKYCEDLERRLANLSTRVNDLEDELTRPETLSDPYLVQVARGGDKVGEFMTYNLQDTIHSGLDFEQVGDEEPEEQSSTMNLSAAVAMAAGMVNGKKDK